MTSPTDPTYTQIEYEEDNFDTLLMPETKPILWPYGQSLAPVDDFLASSDFFDLYPDYDVEPIWNEMNKKPYIQRALEFLTKSNMGEESEFDEFPDFDPEA
jgi:hypothetical protein